jgi:hypothetical protein
MFGALLLVALLILPFIYLLGFLIEKYFTSRDFGRIGNTIINFLLFFGVIVHEISHRIICAITGVPAYNTRVKYRSEKSGIANPHGSVSLKQIYRMTFLQGFLVCFAPLLVGTWVIYFLLQIALYSVFHPIFRIIAVLCSISVLITLSPSRADLSFIKLSYQNDPYHSIYQISLIVLSFLIVWVFVVIYKLVLPIEFLYYFIIIACYICLKYSFIFLRIMIKKIKSRKGNVPSKINTSRLIRRRFKPDIIKGIYKDELEVV